MSDHRMTDEDARQRDELRISRLKGNITGKIKLPMKILCERVAKKLGWKQKLINGKYWIWFDKNNNQIDHADSPENTPSYALLSPDGRELMEDYANEMGFTKFTWESDLKLYSFIAPEDDNNNCGYGAGFNQDKYKACLLAFSHLTGCFNPNEEEIE